MTQEQAIARFGEGVAGQSAMAAAGYVTRVDEKGQRSVIKNDLTDEEKDLVIKEYMAREKARKAAEEAAKAAAAKEAAAKLQAIADEAASKKDKEKAAADAAKTQEKTASDADKEKKKKDADAAKLADDKAKKEKDELGKALDAQDKAAETSRFTGSSLRDIGGALAGEAMTSGIDYQAANLDINQKILIELQKLNVKTLQEVPNTNFTKPLAIGGNSIA